MARQIRFGVWGTGFIAQQLAADVSLVQGALLQGVASRDLSRAKAFAAAHKAAKFYEGLEAMLADKDIDVVYIASPNHRHAADCLQCIHAGKAVLCEKPFAVTELEARTVVDAARERHVFCMEAMWTRFIPAILELKRLIGSGELGRIGLIQGSFAVVAHPSGSRFAAPELGGGALLDLGVYLVSLAQYLFGNPSNVGGQATFAGSGADATSTFQLAWPDGALASFAASLRMNGTNEVTVIGDRGRVHIPDPFYRPHRLEITLYKKAHTSSSTPAPAQPVFKAPRPAYASLLRRQLSPILNFLRRGAVRNFYFPGNGYQFQLAEVVSCLHQGETESSLMPLDDTLTVMRMMDIIRQQWNSSSNATTQG